MTDIVCVCPDKEKYCADLCACCYMGMLDETQKQQREIRGRQLMARNIFNLGREYWLTKLEDGRYERAAGDATCGLCGLAYIEHPEIQGWPTFVVTCSGRIWKL